MVSILFLLLVGIALLLIITVSQSIYLVKQAEAIVIERLGRYHQTLLPGIHFVAPFIDTPRRVVWTYWVYGRNGEFSKTIHTTYRIDMRESLYDFPKQNVITRDNVTIKINALLYYQVTDPKAAVYEFNDLAEGIEKLTQTTLRNIIGSMDLDETLVSRDSINDRLRIILDEATDKWGIKVNRVELQEIMPPADIRDAMEKQMRAERDRRAQILEAEGQKRSAILIAEGQRESAILKARGEAEAQVIAAEAEAQARLQVAQAEAEAIGVLQKVLPVNTNIPSFVIAQQYIKTLPTMMSGKNEKLVVLPYEATSLMGSVAAIKELFPGQK